jgi:hypothetical protein
MTRQRRAADTSLEDHALAEHALSDPWVVKNAIVYYPVAS